MTRFRKTLGLAGVLIAAAAQSSTAKYGLGGCRLRVTVVDQEELDLQGIKEPPLVCRTGEIPKGPWRLHIERDNQLFHMVWPRAEIYGVRVREPTNEKLKAGPFEITVRADPKGQIDVTRCVRASPYLVEIAMDSTERHTISAFGALQIGPYAVVVANCAALENIGRCSDIPEFSCTITITRRWK